MGRLERCLALSQKWLVSPLSFVWDWFAGGLVTDHGLERLYGEFHDEKVALQLVHCAYDRVESLHQALCLGAFAAAGANWLKWFQPLAQTTNGNASDGNFLNRYVCGTVVCFILGLLLRRGVFIAAMRRVKVCSDVIRDGANVLSERS